jgi:hypothetical protein
MVDAGNANTESAVVNASQIRQPAAYLIALAACSVAGGCLILLSYNLAGHGSSPDAYALSFFVGVALLFAPAFLLAGHAPSRLGQLAPVVMGAASYVPTLLRAPERIFFGDEFAHYYQAAETYATGNPFPPNQLVPVSTHYPGFEFAIDTLRNITGLTQYRCGTVLIVVCHIAAVYGVYWLVGTFAGDKVALLAAGVFAISPQFISFDAFYSYETLSIPFVVCGLAAAARASTEDDKRRRGVWYAVAVLCVVSCVPTHHVSSFVLDAGVLVLGVAGFFISSAVTADTVLADRPKAGLHYGGTARPGAQAIVAIRSAVPASRRSAPVLTCVGLVGLGASVGWAGLTHAHLVAYLFGGAQSGLLALYDRYLGHLSRLHGAQAAAAAFRSPEVNSGKPLLELFISKATPVIWLVLCALGVKQLWRKLSPAVVLLGGLVLGYIALLPFLFVSSAQTTAHRSWAYTYVGLAGVGAVGGTWLAQRLRSVIGSRGPFARPRVLGVLRVLGAVALSALLGLSAYGVGVNVYVQYPGPAFLGVDGRIPSDAFTVATWIGEHSTKPPTVIADAQLGIVVVAMDRARLEPELAAQLFLNKAAPNAALRRSVEAGVQYVVIDWQMAHEFPLNGYYIQRYEPPSPAPLPLRYLTRLERLDWLSPVFRTAHYTVLKVR